MEVLGFGGGFGTGLPPAAAAATSLLGRVGFSPPTSFSLDAGFLGGWGLLKEHFGDNTEVDGVAVASTACTTRQYHGNNYKTMVTPGGTESRHNRAPASN